MCILDVPPPPQNLEITEIFQKSCVVSWKSPTDDGGAPLLHYLLERQDLSVKGGWHSVAEIPAGQYKYKCEDLVHKKEYKFRIRAVNKLGPGEPANYPKSILAKDPWGKLAKVYMFLYIFVTNSNCLLLKMNLANLLVLRFLTGMQIMLILNGISQKMVRIAKFTELVVLIKHNYPDIRWRCTNHRLRD